MLSALVALTNFVSERLRRDGSSNAIVTSSRPCCLLITKSLTGLVDFTPVNFSVHSNFENGSELVFKGGGCRTDDSVNDDNGR